MLLHPTISQSPPHPQSICFSSSSSSHFNSLSFAYGLRISPLKKSQFKSFIIKNRYNSSSSSSSSSSSFSKAYNYGTVDYENRPGSMVNWKAIYKRMSVMGDPEKGATQVLNKWENEGKKVSKWELCRIVKEMRKYGRHKLALEIYMWMNNRPERFRISSSDAAIQLDLVSKVHGISGAEDYFKTLPDDLIDKRIYGALLNAYVRARMVEKAETLLLEMKKKNYTSHALPFNVMMTLYMNLKDQEKVESIVSEMIQNNISLDLYTYNIWISSRGSQGSIEKMEEAFEKLNLDPTVNPNWTTYSTMATLYTKNGDFEKAENCLRKIESVITGRDRIPYHYLLSHYGSINRKEEVQRVWETYKTVFPYIPNLGYHSVISSFIRMEDIEEAEILYEEWVSMKSSYDPRIGNLLLAFYVRNHDGFSEKAESFLKEMLEVGKANSSSWEIVAEGYIKENRVSDALICFEKAIANEGSGFWTPKPVNIIAMYNICEAENDEKNKEVLFEVLRKSGVLEDDVYMSLLPFYKGSKSNAGNEVEEVKESGDDDGEGGVDMLLNEFNELQANV